MRGRTSEKPVQSGPWVLRSNTGKPVSSHETETSFVGALKQAMSETHDIELLYDVWEQNIETLRVLHRSSNERPGIVPTMVSHLRSCAVDLVKRANNGSAYPGLGEASGPGRRSTRAFSPSANRNGSAARSISALSPSSLVSFADDHLATLITSATPSQKGSGSR